MEDNILTWLEMWYSRQCDGDWEHTFGIRIHTVDNPGWYVEVDLECTDFENQMMEPVEKERSESDWIYCAVKNQQFCGAGGLGNLREILATFRHWVQSHS